MPLPPLAESAVLSATHTVQLMENQAELTLLSESAIGSPAAFSTAVKPPPTSSSIRYQKSPDSSPERTPHQSSSGITGQLSLESTSDNDFSASEEETVSEVSKQTGVSIDNESSVGILDLDAIQSDSSASHLFLTSPHGLHLHLSPTLSIPSTHTSSRAPTISTTNEFPTNPLPFSNSKLLASSNNDSEPTSKSRDSEPTSKSRDSKPTSKSLKSSDNIVPLGSSDDQSSRPIMKGSGRDSSLVSTVTSNESSTIPKLRIPPSPAISDTPAFSDSNALLNLSKDHPPAPDISLSNESISLVSPHEGFGSSLGLPSELLGSLSVNSISSYIGSDDEGDVIRSALASAMAMHEVLSGGGTASISSSSLVPPSLESSTEVLPGVAQSAVHTSQSPQVHSLPPTNDQSVIGAVNEEVEVQEVERKLEVVERQHCPSHQGANEGPTPHLPSHQGGANEGPTPHLPSHQGGGNEGPTPAAKEESTLHSSSASDQRIPPNVAAKEEEPMDTPPSNEATEERTNSSGVIMDSPSTLPSRNNLCFSSASESMDGLPSTYLNPQDSTLCYDVTDFTASSSFSHSQFLEASHSHLSDPATTSTTTTDPATITASASSSALISSSLASSLAELARVLGKEEGEGEEVEQNEGGTSYNPFDSEGNSDCDFGQIDFQEQNSSSFLAQLDKDEEELKKFNLSHASSSSQAMSFDLRTPGTGNFADSSGEVSISSYFQRKSHQMGELSNTKLPSKDRPCFSDSSGYIIVSPPDRNATPTSQPTATPKTEDPPDNPLDVTLTAGNEDEQASTSGEPLKPSLPGEEIHIPITRSSDSLTPVVTDHTLSGIPKFSLSDASGKSPMTTPVLQYKLIPTNLQHPSNPGNKAISLTPSTTIIAKDSTSYSTKAMVASITSSTSISTPAVAIDKSPAATSLHTGTISTSSTESKSIPTLVTTAGTDSIPTTESILIPTTSKTNSITTSSRNDLIHTNAAAIRTDTISSASPILTSAVSAASELVFPSAYLKADHSFATDLSTVSKSVPSMLSTAPKTVSYTAPVSSATAVVLKNTSTSHSSSSVQTVFETTKNMTIQKTEKLGQLPRTSSPRKTAAIHVKSSPSQLGQLPITGDHTSSPQKTATVRPAPNEHVKSSPSNFMPEVNTDTSPAVSPRAAMTANILSDVRQKLSKLRGELEETRLNAEALMASSKGDIGHVIPTSKSDVIISHVIPTSKSDVITNRVTPTSKSDVITSHVIPGPASKSDAIKSHVIPTSCGVCVSATLETASPVSVLTTLVSESALPVMTPSVVGVPTHAHYSKSSPSPLTSHTFTSTTTIVTSYTASHSPLSSSATSPSLPTHPTPDGTPQSTLGNKLQKIIFTPKKSPSKSANEKLPSKMVSGVSSTDYEPSLLKSSTFTFLSPTFQPAHSSPPSMQYVFATLSSDKASPVTSSLVVSAPSATATSQHTVAVLSPSKPPQTAPPQHSVDVPSPSKPPPPQHSVAIPSPRKPPPPQHSVAVLSPSKPPQTAPPQHSVAVLSPSKPPQTAPPQHSVAVLSPSKPPQFPTQTSVTSLLETTRSLISSGTKSTGKEFTNRETLNTVVTSDQLHSKSPLAHELSSQPSSLAHMISSQSLPPSSLAHMISSQLLPPSLPVARQLSSPAHVTSGQSLPLSSIGHVTPSTSPSLSHVTSSQSLPQTSLTSGPPPSHVISSQSLPRPFQIVSQPLPLTFTPTLMTSKNQTLMYMSPLLSTTLTTSPPPLHTLVETDNSPAMPQDTCKLYVPEALHFSQPCCASTSIADHLQVTNLGDRWLQLAFTISEVYCDGQLMEGRHPVFGLPQRSFISPNQLESIKITFEPVQRGSYEAVLAIYASHVTSSGQDRAMPTASVVLKAIAEEPQVDLCPGHTPTSNGVPNVLDYGTLVSGSTVGISLELTNRGKAKLPLKLSITSENSLNHLYFSFKPLPQSLVLSSPPSSHVHSHTLTFTLPPSQSTSHSYPIEICFTAPRKFLSSTDMSSDPGPLETINAQLEVMVDRASSSAAKPLKIMPLQAAVGVAKLYIPRSLLAVALSCSVGHAITRDVPIKNIGNIPLKVRFGVRGTDTFQFSISPTILQMEPQQESKVSVTFDPSTAPLIVEGVVEARVEPGGPRYEIKLRGTATEPPTHNKGMLTCNRRYLYWGGVTLGESKQLKLLLHNSFPTSVPLRLSIRHPHSPFQLEEEALTLVSGEQTTVMVSYFPFSTAVSVSALDIYDNLHSLKYRIPLCGYGGISQLEVGGVTFSADRKRFLDLGEVKKGRGIKLKLLLFNSGPRAAFLRAVCHKLDDSVPISDNHIHLAPSNLIILPHSTEEVTLYYRPNQAEEDKCRVSTSALSRLVIYTGDEVVRQQLLKTAKEREEKTDKEYPPISSGTNAAFIKDFANQEKISTELELSAFQFENIEKVFSKHLTTLSVTLTGSPRPTQRADQKPSQSGYDVTPQHARHPLSPSYTPAVEDQSKTRAQTGNILSTLLLNLPKTSAGQDSEGYFEMNNFFTESLHWDLLPSLPFMREMEGANIMKAKHTPFAVPIQRGVVAPHSKAKVLVTFQPRRKGLYSQVWTLHLSGPVDLKNNQYKISFNGEAELSKETSFVPHVTESTFIPPHTSLPHAKNINLPQEVVSHTSMEQITKRKTIITTDGSHDLAFKLHDQVLKSHDPQKQQHIAQWLSDNRRHMTQVTSGGAKRTSPEKKVVYLSEQFVQFPDTEVGSNSKIKVRLCNRDIVTHSFEVIRPSRPFTVDHHRFSLESRQCARLPIHFAPELPGKFEGIIAVRTRAGHQTFAQLRGTSFK